MARISPASDLYIFVLSAPYSDRTYWSHADVWNYTTGLVSRPNSKDPNCAVSVHNVSLYVQRHHPAGASSESSDLSVRGVALMSAPQLDARAEAEASSNPSILAITPTTPTVSDSKDDKLRRLWVMWPQTEGYSKSTLLAAVVAASDTKRKFVGIQTVTTCDAATTNRQRVMLFVQYHNGVSLKMLKKKCTEQFPSGAIFGSLGNLHPLDSMLTLEGEYSSAGNKRVLSYTETDELLKKDVETLTEAQMRECLKRLKVERDQQISAAVAPADEGY